MICCSALAIAGAGALGSAGLAPARRMVTGRAGIVLEFSAASAILVLAGAVLLGAVAPAAPLGFLADAGCLALQSVGIAHEW